MGSVVSTKGGWMLSELELGLDPREAMPWAFISHAHADHFGRHERILCSWETGILLERRFGVAKANLEPLAWDRPCRVNGWELSLLPAGHIIGSAMLMARRETDGHRILYTGDFKMRESRTAEKSRWVEADELIMETTFGLPHYHFPEREVVENQILSFVESALLEGVTPILLGYALGKAQEALALCASHGLTCVLHPSVAEMAEASVMAGAEKWPYRRMDGKVEGSVVVIAPPNALNSPAIRRIKHKRSAILTGWAMNESARYRYRTDAAFVLSDHADYRGLWQAVEEVKPRLVWTLHGYSREFAADLRAAGIEAWSLEAQDQLEMELMPVTTSTEHMEWPRPEGGLRDLSELVSEVMQRTGHIEKTNLVAEYFKKQGVEELSLAVRYLSGRLFQMGETTSLGLGSSGIKRALIEASGRTAMRYHEHSRVQNDMARTARLLMEEAKELKPESWSLNRFQEWLENLARLTNPASKQVSLVEGLRSMHPAEIETSIRLLSGAWRMGLSEGLVEMSLQRAYGVDEKGWRLAKMRCPDLGVLASYVAQGQWDAVTMQVMGPIKCMLASPEVDVESIVQRLEGGVWQVEAKYDGIRIQIHKSGKRVELYSRDLKPMGYQFPEIVGAVEGLEGDFVMDGELIAYAEGRKLGFHDLQKRLGVKLPQGDLFLGNSVPVSVVVFDLLWENGRDLTQISLRERRKCLERRAWDETVRLIEAEWLGDPERLERAFQRERRAGNEGLVVKNPESTYQAGRRGKSWLKLKTILETLDCVVIAAEQGHGKRSEWLSDYSFAVRDEKSGQLRMIGKAYSGLKDEQIEELTEHFQRHTLQQKGKKHLVEPNIVLEIAFEGIKASKRHDSGLALRFPRIKAWRQDKSQAEIDSLAYAMSLAERAKVSR